MKRRIPIWFSLILLTAIVLSVITLVNFSLVSTRRSMVKVEFETIADFQINEKFQDIEFLAAVWANLIQANGGEVRDFSNRSEKILKDYNDNVVESLRVAPDGVIKYVYPYAFSDEIGTDVNKEGILSQGANRSRYTGLDLISEPELLEDGDYRLSFCHPVYVKDKVGKMEFWGFSIVTVRVSDLFASLGLRELGIQSSFRLYRMDARNGDQTLLDNTTGALRNPVYYYFSAPNGTFVLEGEWDGGWITGNEILIEIVIGLCTVIAGLLILMNLRFRRNMKTLSKISYTDELTGLYNRHMLRSTFDNMDGTQHHVALLFVDFDHFKLINDNEGHDAGDEALKQGAAFFVSIFGKESCYRYGGDEFLLLMMDVSDSEALEKAKHLRELRKITFQGKDIPVAVSGGFASGDCCTANDLRALIRLADENLYNAKEGGRNRIVGGTESKN